MSTVVVSLAFALTVLSIRSGRTTVVVTETEY
jgi:hypothetical protein